MAYLHVAIAVVVRNGAVLLTRRLAGDRFAALWEFPGGKLLPAESADACVHREVAEELGIQVSLVGRLAPVTHDYGDLQVCLHPFIATIDCGEPKPLASLEMRWVPTADLDQVPFPAANAQFVGGLPAIIAMLIPPER